MDDQKELVKNLDKFREKKIAVIGDVMLDRFLIGNSSRISPEAPVPVVKIEKEITALGGAANVAANIAALGGEAILVGTIGKDRPAKEFLGLLKKHGLDAGGIILDSNGQTIEKTRLLSANKQIARIDRESLGSTSQAIENKIINFIKNGIRSWDGVVFSDYDKGTLTPAIARIAMFSAKKLNKPVVVDAKPKNFKYFRGATIIAPNQKEAFEVAGVLDVKTAGRLIQKKLRCHVLITRGHEGATLFCGNRIQHIPTVPREVFDIVGAGDTVTAALAMALVSGFSVLKAALIANLAAGIVIGKQGTAVVSRDELKEAAHLI